MSLSVEYAGQTHRGRVRKENEDRWYADAQTRIFVIADGMGGALGGELASRIVVEVLPQLLVERMDNVEEFNDDSAVKIVLDVLCLLSRRLQEESQGIPGVEGLGSTVVLLIVRGDQALVAHLGDSRAYLLRNGTLTQLTHDHTIIQLLLDAGEITPEEVAGHPARGRLTRYVGMEGEPLPEGRCQDVQLNDVFLLCSDGLTGMLSDDDVARILQQSIAPKSICRQLIKAANKAGGKDNITVIVLKAFDRSSPAEEGE